MFIDRVGSFEAGTRVVLPSLASFMRCV